MVEGVVSTAIGSREIRQQIDEGQGFGFDGFVYYPPERWGDEKVQQLLSRNPAFFKNYELDDLWIIGTNYEDDRFLIFPKTCLLSILEVFDHYDLNGKLPDDDSISFLEPNL